MTTGAAGDIQQRFGAGPHMRFDQRVDPLRLAGIVFSGIDGVVERGRLGEHCSPV